MVLEAIVASLHAARQQVDGRFPLRCEAVREFGPPAVARQPYLGIALPTQEWEGARKCALKIACFT